MKFVMKLMGKILKTRNALKIMFGLGLAMLFWRNTGWVKTFSFEFNREKAEPLALQLLIESFENTRWFQREYYEVHIVGDSCGLVYNYYPQKEILSYAMDPCSGFGGHFIISEAALISLKKQDLTYDEVRMRFKKPPPNLDLAIPNSLCNLLW
jgi:hypothetical protein